MMGGGVSVKLGLYLQRRKHLKEAFWWFDVSCNLSMNISLIFLNNKREPSSHRFVYKMQNNTIR